jgi:hypothetical protein
MARIQNTRPKGRAIRFSSAEASALRWKEMRMATATMDMYVARRSQERNALCRAACQVWDLQGGFMEEEVLRTAFCGAVVAGIGVVVVEEKRT